MKRDHLLKIAKSLICNTEVAKCFRDNNKTETRRLPKSEASAPRYKVDDILWIREPARVTLCHSLSDKISYRYKADGKYMEQATIKIPHRFINNNTMKENTLTSRLPIWITRESDVPNGCIKEMARMFYRVIYVKYQELQLITIDEIIEEGYIPACRTRGEDRDSAYEWWIYLWDKTAPKGKKWKDNPLVEVYGLERIEIE